MALGFYGEAHRGGVAKSGIAVIAGSACNVPCEACETYGILTLPLQLNYADGKSYRDRVDIQPAEVYARMPAEVPTTSLPAASDVYGVLGAAREAGCAAVVVVTLGSAYSGTYDFVAHIAGEQRDLKALVVDTGRLDYGAGVAAVMAAKLIEAGMPFEELETALGRYARASGALVTVSTLEYLVAGGRLGRAKRAVGNLLNVRPVLDCTPAGLVQVAHARGGKAALEKLVDKATARLMGYPQAIVRVVHAGAPDLGERVARRLREAVPRARVKVGEASTVVGAHVGPGAVGVCYQGLDADDSVFEPW